MKYTVRPYTKYINQWNVRMTCHVEHAKSNSTSAFAFVRHPTTVACDERIGGHTHRAFTSTNWMPRVQLATMYTCVLLKTLLFTWGTCSSVLKFNPPWIPSIVYGKWDAIYWHSLSIVLTIRWWPSNKSDAVVSHRETCRLLNPSQSWAHQNNLSGSLSTAAPVDHTVDHIADVSFVLVDSHHCHSVFI